MQHPEPIIPGPGQESIWAYPRPPRLEETARRIRVIVSGVTIAETTRAKRVLETSHPPTYYIPPQDILMRHLFPSGRTTFCEYKGTARYYSVSAGERTVQDAAWCYPNPAREYAALANYVAFYPSRVDACYVDDELVQAQEGDFYGGWITREIVGPFKGGPGTSGW